MIMEKKNIYYAPDCEAVEMRAEGVICGSEVNGNLIPPGFEDGGNLDLS